jgi:hypothetical protein
MATFNFDENVVHGRQYIAGRDINLVSSSTAEALRALNDLLRETELAVSSGAISPVTGSKATDEISNAIDVMKAGNSDAPRRVAGFLARAREILSTAALVPGLVEAMSRAIDAVRALG